MSRDLKPPTLEDVAHELAKPGDVQGAAPGAPLAPTTPPDEPWQTVDISHYGARSLDPCDCGAPTQHGPHDKSCAVFRTSAPPASDPRPQPDLAPPGRDAVPNGHERPTDRSQSESGTFTTPPPRGAQEGGIPSEPSAAPAPAPETPRGDREETIAFLRLMARAANAGYWALHVDAKPGLDAEARHLLCLARDAIHKNLRAYGEDVPAPALPSTAPRERSVPAESVETAVERLDNLLAALNLPLPDRLHLKALREVLPEIRAELRAALPADSEVMP